MLLTVRCAETPPGNREGMGRVTIHKPEDLPETVKSLTARVMAEKGNFIMQKVPSKSKRTMLAVVALLALVAVFSLTYFTLRPQPKTGGKTVYVEIVKSQGETILFEIKTDAEYLRQAMEEQDLIQGEEGSYGLFVKTVDGVTVDDGKQEWWCFTKGGEMLMTSVDATPIYDGDRYEITLIAGY